MKHTIPGSGVKAVIAVGLGLVAGAVVGQGAARLAFSKATMYETMARLHADTRTDFVFVNQTASAAKTFELAAGSTAKVIKAAAKQFGKEDVNVASITVLEDALPDATSGRDKMKAAVAYVRGRIPRDPGQPNPMYQFGFAVRGEAKAMAGGLGSGTWPFGSLTADQQQRALDLMRAAQYELPAASLAAAFQQFYQAENPSR